MARCFRQQDQRELRRQRKRLRDLCANEAEGDDENLLEVDDVEELCRELSRAQLEALCSDVEGQVDEAGKRSLLEQALQTVYESKGEVWLLLCYVSLCQNCYIVFSRSCSGLVCNTAGGEGWSRALCACVGRVPHSVTQAGGHDSYVFHPLGGVGSAETSLLRKAKSNLLMIYLYQSVSISVSIDYYCIAQRSDCDRVLTAFWRPLYIVLLS
jgi:hypothetical protein